MVKRRKPIRRQRMTTVTVYDDWSCPVNPAHGRLLDYDYGRIAYCPHADCNGAGQSPIWTPEQIRELREKHGNTNATTPTTTS